MALRTRIRGGLGVSAIALTVSAFALPAVAQAQDAAPAADEATDGDAIVVTGIRASLDQSASIKRRTPTIVEAISAEDIGKLPDVSIADSLARLPGVTAQRLEGRDQRLSIRGLGPDFGTTLLNGREQVTVGDNRGVEYDQYPSEFFKNVVVNKSADAGLIAAGISGTVDLRMLRPLAQNKRIVAVQLRGQMNGMKALNPDMSRYGYRASATYVDQFADDTFGIALGVSVTDAPSQDERYNAWGFPNADYNHDNNDATPNICYVALVDGKCPLVLGGAKPYVQSNKLRRYGGVATLEWQPSDNFHSTLDVLYSKFKETQMLRGIEFPINIGWGSGASFPTGVVVTNGLITDATFGNIHAVQRNDTNRRDAENVSIGWNNVFTISDGMHLTVDASYSHAKRTDFLLETYTGTGYGTGGPADTIRITANPNGTFDIVPTIDYSNQSIFGLTDPRGWGYNGTTAVVQAGFLNQPSFKDDLYSLRASLDGEFGDAGILKGWEIGGNFSHRKKVSAYKSYFLCPTGAGTNCTVSSGTPQFVSIPTAAVIGTVPLAYLGVPKMLALDPLYLYNNSLKPVFDNRPSSLVRDNNIIEDVWTGYAKVNLDGELGGKRVTGSLGVQVIHTKQKSNGTLANFSVVQPGNIPVVTIAPATGGDSYTNINPSAVLAVELLDNTFVKMSASHTMVRARLDQLRVNQDVGVNFTKLANTDPANSGFSATGGNPALRPYQSTNIDASVEKYFAKGGYVAVSGFYKHLSDFVDTNNAVQYDFSALAAALKTAIPSVVIGTTQGRLSLPGNTGRGDLMGVEATLQLPFGLLSDGLDGFGFYGSASYADSTIKLGTNTNAITLPGLSDWVLNASLYYEKNGFQVRGSYRYRSKFLAEIAGLSANPEFRTAKAEGIVDAQIGYEFQEGSALQGLSIMFQGKNLTDRPFVTYEGDDPRRVRDYQRYGRDFYVTVGYKF